MIDIWKSFCYPLIWRKFSKLLQILFAVHYSFKVQYIVGRFGMILQVCSLFLGARCIAWFSITENASLSIWILCYTVMVDIIMYIMYIYICILCILCNVYYVILCMLYYVILCMVQDFHTTSLTCPAPSARSTFQRYPSIGSKVWVTQWITQKVCWTTLSRKPEWEMGINKDRICFSLFLLPLW